MRMNERRETSLDPMGMLGFTSRIKTLRRWPLTLASRFFFDTLYVRLRGEGPSIEDYGR